VELRTPGSLALTEPHIRTRYFLQHEREVFQATILLFDPATGRPRCVIDGNAITTARTGAAGALGLELLARPDSSRLTVFGTGVQARSQLRFALRTLPKLTYVQYVSMNCRVDPAFESVFADQCDIRCARNADEAVAESDVVITATPGAGPLSKQARCVLAHI
jgi:ornithine cyclodeaminase